MHMVYRFALLISLFATLHTHLCAQWTRTSGPDGVSTHCFAASGSKLFAGADDGVYLTTDNGLIWNRVTPLLLSATTTALRFSGDKLFAGVFGPGVLVTTDEGTTWTKTNTGLTNASIMDMAVSGDYLYLATRDAGIFRSTDQGASWALINNGLPETWIRAIVASGPDVFAGTRYHGVVHSTDYGEHWTESSTGLPITSIYALAMRGSTVFAGGFGGAFSTTNNGASWNDLNTSGLFGAYFYDFAFFDSNIIAGTNVGAFLSTNEGASWRSINTGLPDSTLCYALLVSGDYLYAATYQNNVWKRRLSDVITSTEHLPVEDAIECTLDENYPNPVRSSTRIPFRLATPTFVRLQVYDIFGRVVDDLACEEMPAGSHARDWSAARMRTGMYFIRLQAGSTIKTTRVIVAH